MICNNYVFITTSGSNMELPTIISVDFTGWLITNMESFCFQGGWDILPFVFFFWCGFGWFLFYSSRLVRLFLSGLHSLHIPFDCFHCLWTILFCIGACQSWPCQKVSLLNCPKPFIFYWESRCRMHVLH